MAPSAINSQVVIGCAHLPHLYDAPSHSVLPESRSRHPLQHIAPHLAFSQWISIGLMELASLPYPKICMQDALDNVAKTIAPCSYPRLRTHVALDYFTL